MFEGKTFMNSAAALFDVIGNDVLLIGIATHKDDIRLMPGHTFEIPARTLSDNVTQSHRKYNEAFVILAPDETIASRMETDAEKLAKKLGQSIQRHKRSSLQSTPSKFHLSLNEIELTDTLLDDAGEVALRA